MNTDRLPEVRFFSKFCLKGCLYGGQSVTISYKKFESALVSDVVDVQWLRDTVIYGKPVKFTDRLFGNYSPKLGIFELYNGGTILHLMIGKPSFVPVLSTIFTSQQQVLSHDSLGDGKTLSDFVNTPNATGMTAAHLAVQHGDIKAFVALRKYGAKLTEKREVGLWDGENMVTINHSPLSYFFSNSAFVKKCFNDYGDLITELFVLAIENKVKKADIVARLEENKSIVTLNILSEIVDYLRENRSEQICQEVFLESYKIFDFNLISLFEDGARLIKIVSSFVADLAEKKSSKCSLVMKECFLENDAIALKLLDGTLSGLGEEEILCELQTRARQFMVDIPDVDNKIVEVESISQVPLPELESVSVDIQSFAMEVVKKIQSNQAYWDAITKELGPNPQLLHVLVRLCGFGMNFLEAFINAVDVDSHPDVGAFLSQYISSLSADELLAISMLGNKSRDAYSLACKYKLIDILGLLLKRGGELSIFTSTTESLVNKALDYYDGKVFEYLITQNILKFDMHLVLIQALKYRLTEAIEVYARNVPEMDMIISGQDGYQTATPRYTILSIILLLIKQQSAVVVMGEEGSEPVQDAIASIEDLCQSIEILNKYSKIYYCIDNPNAFNRTITLVSQLAESDIEVISRIRSVIIEGYQKMDLSDDQRGKIERAELGQYEGRSVTTARSGITMLQDQKSNYDDFELGNDKDFADISNHDGSDTEVVGELGGVVHNELFN